MTPALTDAIAMVLGHTPPKRLGVAVSGGGDSLALLAALMPFSRTHDIALHVVTVDHGIRPEAQQEIMHVRDLCARWGIEHHVKIWTGWHGQGNFQAAARAARYALMSEWAHDHQITHIALGHTADDQAETFVMRLARGAGVDGLSAMSARRVRDGITWVRPFLRIGRATLRDALTRADLTWCDDPSNENRDYDRIKARDALKVLAPLGITIGGLVQIADHMAKARDALSWQTVSAARDVVTLRDRVVTLDKPGFYAQPEEIGRRLVAQSIHWVSGSHYGPRGPAVARTLEAVRDGQTSTLDGCQVLTQDGAIWIFREYNAVRDTRCSLEQAWDGRWCLAGPADHRPDLELRALGFDALNDIADWRDLGLPRAALASTPSVWSGDTLVAAPIARPDAEWTAKLEHDADAYFAALLSH